MSNFINLTQRCCDYLLFLYHRCAQIIVRNDQRCTLIQPGYISLIEYLSSTNTQMILTPTSIQINQFRIDPTAFYFQGTNLNKIWNFIYYELNQSFTNQVVNTVLPVLLGQSNNESAEGYNTDVFYYVTILDKITYYIDENDSISQINLNLLYQYKGPLFTYSIQSNNPLSSSLWSNIIFNINNISYLKTLEWISFTPMYLYNTSSDNVYNNWTNKSCNLFQFVANQNINTDPSLLTEPIYILLTFSKHIYSTLHDPSKNRYVLYMTPEYADAINIWIRTINDIPNTNNVEVLYMNNEMTLDYFEVSSYLFQASDIITTNEITQLLGTTLFQPLNVSVPQTDYETIYDFFKTTKLNYAILNLDSYFNEFQSNYGIYSQINSYNYWFCIPDELYYATSLFPINHILCTRLYLLCYNPCYFGLNKGSIIFYNATNETSASPLFTINTSQSLPTAGENDYPATTPMSVPSTSVGYYDVSFDISNPIITYKSGTTSLYNKIQVFEIDMISFKAQNPTVTNFLVVERHSYPSCVLDSNTNSYVSPTLTYPPSDVNEVFNTYFGGSTTMSSYGNQQVETPICFRLFSDLSTSNSNYPPASPLYYINPAVLI